MNDTSSAAGLSRQLIRLLLRRRERGDISASLRAKLRLHVADAVAIGWAATASPPLSQQLMDAMCLGVEGGACQVFGSDRRLPPSLAAFANAALIHALDFDDIHDISRLHPTAVTLPAALAAAQLTQAPMSRVLDAVTLGNELMCRLGAMLRPQGNGPGSDWFLTQLFGYFGAAFTAGVVMEQSEDQLVAGFGFAYMQAAGGKEAGFGVGCTGRSIYPAFSAMGGMIAAQLSQAGLTGPASALDGAANLFRLYLQGDPSEAQQAQLLDTEHWEFAATCIKPWPSCRLSHPYVAAGLALRQQLGGEGIEHLEVAVNGSAAKLCHPLAQRRRPETLQDAKYSVPYMTAYALVHGQVDLPGLRQEALSDPEVLALTDCISIVETLPDGPGHPPAQLQAITTSGKALRVTAPMDFDLDERGVQTKFIHCLAQAGLEDCAPAAWQALLSADALPDVALLMNPALAQPQGQRRQPE
ncbi:MmgE/PrpD family protein [Bordetella avium]|uniref:MmgE/PrpD family protein n=1 Tax=Bordetella avium TaxID=521 RepID=UPI000E6A7F79|nr:MmgE/PrpD family protein [Bordetella avium]RIQ34528.1 hypothetical protein D0849_07840 [Bordetella avium]